MVSLSTHPSADGVSSWLTAPLGGFAGACFTVFGKSNLLSIVLMVGWWHPCVSSVRGVAFQLLERFCMDWNKIISSIKASGMTQEQIAQDIGVASGTLSDLYNGNITEPKWSKGNELLRLYEERCLTKVM